MRSYGAVSSLSINHSINYLSIVPLSTRVRDDDVEKKIKIVVNKFKLGLTWSTTIWKHSTYVAIRFCTPK